MWAKSKIFKLTEKLLRFPASEENRAFLEKIPMDDFNIPGINTSMTGLSNDISHFCGQSN